MSELAALAAARRRLARAESGWRSADGLTDLEEGLALLEEVLMDGTEAHRPVAGNLLATYAARLCASVRQAVAGDPALPEPELQHFFRLLIERYYEGYPAAEKQKALEQLAGITNP